MKMQLLCKRNVVFLSLKLLGNTFIVFNCGLGLCQRSPHTRTATRKGKSGGSKSERSCPAESAHTGAEIRDAHTEEGSLIRKL